jgi:DNA-binding transcriptional LysR family regulator
VNDQISDLKLLCQLAAAGSLSEAARRLESSPPAMSRRLAMMEERLGVRLFDRTSRRFELTQEGALLHHRALQILASIEDAEAEASATGATMRGLLRVGAPLQIGRRLVAPVVGRFAELHPQVELQFILSNAELDVFDDGLDVAIRAGLPTDPSLVARKLFDSRRVVCAAPSYIAAHGMPATPDDLLQHRCLRLLRGQRTLDRWRFRENGAVRTVEVGGTLSTTNGELLHEWVLEGRGLGLKALWNVEADLVAGRLVECLADYACDEVGLYATFQKQAFMPRRIRVFLDHLIDALATPQP